MKFSNEINYILKFGDSGVIDLAFGAERFKENGHKIIRCGLGSHSISFIITKIIKQDDNMIQFETVNNEVVSLKIVTAEDYRIFKGMLFSQSSPEILDDSEVQEFITRNRGY